jgi:hypothetical protein
MHKENAMKLFRITILLVVLSMSSFSYGWGQEHFGPDDKDQMGWSPDWPDGTKSILAHESRVYSTWVNGFGRYYFDATVQQINELLDLFSKLQILDHEVWIESGRQTCQSFQKKPVGYNAFFYIPGKPGPSYLGLRAHEKVENGWTLPTLRIYTDLKGELLGQLKLPDHLIVHSDVAGCPNTKTPMPKRKPFVTRFLFEDGSPASGMGFQTKITLWLKNQQSGYVLGSADFQGIFEMFFSEDEMAKLATGQMWLTVTCGNDLTTPKPTDPKIAVECLTAHTLFDSAEQEKKSIGSSQDDFIRDFNAAYSHAKTCVVKKMSGCEYFGRLVYKNDASGINGHELVFEKIMITMPWQRMIEVDKEGYFKVVYSFHLRMSS